MLIRVIPHTHHRIYELDPGLPLFASLKRLLYLLMCYNLGLLRLTHIYESGEGKGADIGSRARASCQRTASATSC